MRTFLAHPRKILTLHTHTVFFSFPCRNSKEGKSQDGDGEGKLTDAHGKEGKGKSENVDREGGEMENEKPCQTYLEKKLIVNNNFGTGVLIEI